MIRLEDLPKPYHVKEETLVLINNILERDKVLKYLEKLGWKWFLGYRRVKEGFEYNIKKPTEYNPYPKETTWILNLNPNTCYLTHALT